MPSYLELRQEIWWGLEFQPPSLMYLCERLRAFFNVSAVALGSKGDNNHLSGYHRSRNWIQRSAYCTNRIYSVTETTGNRTGGDPNWLCAIDITIPREQLLPMCQRLDAAVRSGTLEKVTEWYGNLDGDTRVDGYNNIQNRAASSDSSHLWHAHISLDRGRAGEDHADLYAILTGTGGTPATKKGDSMLIRSGAGDGSIYYVPGGLAASGKPAAFAMYPPVLDTFVKSGMPYVQLPTGVSVDAAGFDTAPQPLSVDVELSPEDLAAVAAAAEAGAEAGAPTQEELEAAAFEGAQKAEDQ